MHSFDATTRSDIGPYLSPEALAKKARFSAGFRPSLGGLPFNSLSSISVVDVWNFWFATREGRRQAMRAARLYRMQYIQTSPYLGVVVGERRSGQTFWLRRPPVAQSVTARPSSHPQGEWSYFSEKGV